MPLIREALATDEAAWLRMRCDLWPDGTVDEHKQGIARYFAGHRHEPRHVLLAIDDRGGAVGFAELSIRNVVDSCTTDHVGYLEGWYVAPDFRRQGVGRALVQAAERWAQSEGCTEFASDVVIGNESSAAAHAALGFEETSCVRNFRKSLSSASQPVARSARPGSTPR